MRHILVAIVLFTSAGAALSLSNAASPRRDVDAALRAQVRAGVTEAGELIRRFGAPLSREPRRGPGRSELLGYSHLALVPSVLPRLPLPGLGGAAAPDTFFEVSDGIVTRYWTRL